jgi:hypothetical protein
LKLVGTRLTSPNVLPECDDQAKFLKHTTALAVQQRHVCLSFFKGFDDGRFVLVIAEHLNYVAERTNRAHRLERAHFCAASTEAWD